jgi:hypothetical protein
MLWRDAQGVIHAILHDEQGKSRCTATGRHAFSDDGGAHWTYGETDAYTGDVTWQAEGIERDKAGGGVSAPSPVSAHAHAPAPAPSSTSFYRRERPHMIVSAAGAPLYLTNGVQLNTSNDRSWTLIQPTAAAASTPASLASVSAAAPCPANGSLIALHLHTDPSGLIVLPLFAGKDHNQLTKFRSIVHNASVVIPGSCAVSVNATAALIRPTAVGVGTAFLDLMLVYGSVNVSYTYSFVVADDDGVATTTPAAAATGLVGGAHGVAWLSGAV